MQLDHPCAPFRIFSFCDILDTMETTYKLNVRELTPDFITTIQNMYLNRNIEITIREELDETEYLMSSPANREHLLKAIKNVEDGKNIITFETLEEAKQCAEKWAAEN